MKQKRLLLIGVALPMLLAAASAGAQQPSRPSDDPIGASLFDPDLIMTHQGDIALKDTQRQVIIDEIKKAQSNMVETQFKMKAATKDLVDLLRATKVDEAKAIAALHKLTMIEDEMKTMHITMMVRIKNALSKEQQDQLRASSK